MLRFRHRKDVARHALHARRRHRVHDIEGRALRIADHRDATDRKIGSRHMDRAAVGNDRGNRRIDVGRVKIAEPARPRAAREHIGIERQHAAGIAAVAAPDHAVIDTAGRRGIGGARDRPADDGAIEARRAIGIAGHQFVPDEAALGVRHHHSPFRIWGRKGPEVRRRGSARSRRRSCACRRSTGRPGRAAYGRRP